MRSAVGVTWRVCLADLPLLAELVLAFRADAYALDLGWREHPCVLAGHDSPTVLTFGHTLSRVEATASPIAFLTNCTYMRATPACSFVTVWTAKARLEPGGDWSRAGIDPSGGLLVSLRRRGTVAREAAICCRETACCGAAVSEKTETYCCHGTV